MLLAVATALRGLTMAGYPSALWFDDSFEYLGVALRPSPYPIRPNGYPVLLSLLEPFHSFPLVIAVQHVMGLATGVMIYALLRRSTVYSFPRRGNDGSADAGNGGDDGRAVPPAWVGALATTPILLDANVIALEQSVLSDTMFTFLLTAGAVVLLWRRNATVVMATGAGLLIAAATLTRSAGLPLLAILIGCLLLRRVRWRAVAAVTVACALPIAAYAAWFHAHHGEYGLTRSSGVILWSRTAPFADCRITRPPPAEAVLCPRLPPDRRPEPTNFLWAQDSPLTRLGARPGEQRAPRRADRFTAESNTVAGGFARRTILAQPGDYLAAVGFDLARTFGWGIKFHSQPVIYNMYEFPDLEGTLPKRAEIPGGTFHGDLRAYEGDEPGVIRTRVVEPYAGIMRAYQRVGWLPGFAIGALVLAGLAGIVHTWRRRPDDTGARTDAGDGAGAAGDRTSGPDEDAGPDGPDERRFGRLRELPRFPRPRWIARPGPAALLPWAMATALLVLPVLVAGYGPRYRLAALPMVCLAAAIAISDLRRAASRGRPRS